jgi:hypothetical protein
MSSVICGIHSSFNFFVPFMVVKVVSHSFPHETHFCMGTHSTFHFREMVEDPWCVNRMASGTKLELLALELAVVVTTLLECTQGCPCMNSGLQTLSYATRTDSSVSKIGNSDELGNYSEGWPLL